MRCSSKSRDIDPGLLAVFFLRDTPVLDELACHFFLHVPQRATPHYNSRREFGRLGLALRPNRGPCCVPLLGMERGFHENRCATIPSSARAAVGSAWQARPTPSSGKLEPEFPRLMHLKAGAHGR